MRDFVRGVEIEGANSSKWNYVDKLRFTISVNEDILDIQMRPGQDVFLDELIIAIGKFLWEYQKEYKESIEVRTPACWYRYTRMESIEKARDIFLETDDGWGLPDREFVLHTIGTTGRCSGVHCNVYSFLNLLVAEGVLEDDEGIYEYPSYAGGDPEKPKFQDCVTLVAPRLTEYEDGWCNGAERPESVVKYGVCRKPPIADEGEVTKKKRKSKAKEEATDSANASVAKEDIPVTGKVGAFADTGNLVADSTNDATPA